MTHYLPGKTEIIPCAGSTLSAPERKKPEINQKWLAQFI
jgi:hypothetical protein